MQVPLPAQRPREFSMAIPAHSGPGPFTSSSLSYSGLPLLLGGSRNQAPRPASIHGTLSALSLPISKPSARNPMCSPTLMSSQQLTTCVILLNPFPLYQSVYWVCQNKVSETGGLKQQRFIFSQSRRPEVQDQGVDRVGFF